jgi:hypothetical protein
MALKDPKTEVDLAIARANAEFELAIAKKLFDSAVFNNYPERVVDFLRERVKEAEAAAEQQKIRISSMKEFIEQTLKKYARAPKPTQNFLPQNV